jgi:hypothetical protein
VGKVNITIHRERKKGMIAETIYLTVAAERHSSTVSPFLEAPHLKTGCALLDPRQANLGVGRMNRSTCSNLTIKKQLKRSWQVHCYM